MRLVAFITQSSDRPDPDAPPHRRLGRGPHRRAEPPQGPAPRGARELRQRDGGHATAHPPVFARSTITPYTQSTAIEIPIPWAKQSLFNARVPGKLQYSNPGTHTVTAQRAFGASTNRLIQFATLRGQAQRHQPREHQGIRRWLGHHGDLQVVNAHDTHRGLQN